MTVMDEMTAQGVFFAPTRDGMRLPIIDLTHPRFFVPDDPAASAALKARALQEERSRRFLPTFLLRLIGRRMVAQSKLMQALFQPGRPFLDGLSTYALKLGANNLVPPFDGPADRRFAAAPHLALLRLRMQQVARFLAEGLAQDLPHRLGAPLHLVNIAGGPAMDSLNAVIMLRRRHGELVRRPIRIHVLDSDEAGPWFGAQALDALTSPGAPLAGLDIQLTHVSYDWNKPEELEQYVAMLGQDAVTAASSEGGLFEYGDDEAVVANLKALRAGGVVLISGSVTSDDPKRRRTIASGPFRLFPRGIAGLAPLARAAGFTVEKAESAILSEQMLLRPTA